MKERVRGQYTDPERAIESSDPELTEGRRNRGQVKYRQPWEEKSILMVKRRRVSVVLDLLFQQLETQHQEP